MSALLSRLEAACRQTRGNIDLIDRQIGQRAERMATTAHVKGRPFGRSTQLWTRDDERRLLEYVDRIRFERRAEIDGLSRKLARQELDLAVALSRLRQTGDRAA